MSTTTQVAHEHPKIEPRFDTNGIVWNRKFSGRKPRLLFLITEDWYFRSHRLDLAREAQKAGMEVLVATLAEDNGKWIRDEGFKYLPIPFVKGTRNPLLEMFAVIKLSQLYRRERPDIVHHVALKPILYGSWATRLARVPAVVNAFGGLGFVFLATDWRARLLRIGVTAVLRSALSLTNSCVLFQNSGDRDKLIKRNIVQQSQTVIIPGTGVDTKVFTPQPEDTGVPVVILGSRMLWDKGVGEFVQAAQLLKQEKIAVRCVLVGRTDVRSPTHIPEAQLLEWQKQGLVEWWGHQDDMPQVLSAAHVVVLPSYYEGFPKVLLEACACGKPVVATAIPGCKEIVRGGENGFLIPAKDPGALAKAIRVLLENPALRARMGKRGREIAEREFSADRMARQTLAVYQELLENC
jgi:glycosyltransferase involved in cell wall biosynthesis